MKTRVLLTCLALAVGMLSATTYQAAAQAGGGGGGGRGGGGGGRGGRGGILTTEQTTALTDALAADTQLTGLQEKLTAAQKDAVNAALDKAATDASVKAKIQAVSDIQTQIAMERYTKGVKTVAATITADQKTQLDASPNGRGYTQAYQTLFGGAMAGGRGGANGGRGGAGGGRGGRGGRGGAAPGN